MTEKNKFFPCDAEHFSKVYHGKVTEEQEERTAKALKEYRERNNFPEELNKKHGGLIRMDLNKLSFAELKAKIGELEKAKESVGAKSVGVWQVGKAYVLRTVTMIDVGKLVEVTPNELVLESAAWIADTGRWAAFLQNGTYDECEPFPQGRVIVGRNALIDAVLWLHGTDFKVK